MITDHKAHALRHLEIMREAVCEAAEPVGGDVHTRKFALAMMDLVAGSLGNDESTINESIRLNNENCLSVHGRELLEHEVVTCIYSIAASLLVSMAIGLQMNLLRCSEKEESLKDMLDGMRDIHHDLFTHEVREYSSKALVGMIAKLLGGMK